MFIVRLQSQWCIERGASDFFVDLSPASAVGDVARIISETLRSKTWPSGDASNLDALHEYVWAFFEERWGKEIRIHLLVPEYLQKKERLLVAKLSCVFASAFINAISSIIDAREVVIADIRKIKIFIYA